MKFKHKVFLHFSHIFMALAAMKMERSIVVNLVRVL